MTSAVRTPAVAGRFYPGRAEDLLREVREFTSPSKTPIETGRIDTIDFDVLRGLGETLADVIADHHEEDQKAERQAKVLIIASSDMNHYESDTITRIKDHKAVERVLAMDARGLWEVVLNEDISMCGFGPTVVMLTAAKLLGATSATLVEYATSGDVSGDYESVVGYAGIIVA